MAAKEKEKEVKVDWELLREDIRGTQACKKYQRIMKTVSESFDLDRLEKEARSLHANRTVRSLDVKKHNPREFSEANLREMQNRARLVEIRISLTKYREQVENAIRATRRYLYVEFADRTGFKTREDRKMYFDRFFNSGDQLLSNVEWLISTIDHIIKDIDQAGFGLRNVFEVLDMVYNKEKVV